MDPKQLYDVVVIGGGPAGLTAGLYLARAKYRVLIVEKAAFGGQITITDQVVNYPGVLHTSGRELTETMRQQAQSFGAEFLLAEVTGLSLDDTVKTVKTDRGDLSCFGVLWATGAHPRMVGFPGEEAFRGRGVAYCATCDGEFFTGRDVFVVGGGFAAGGGSRLPHQIRPPRDHPHPGQGFFLCPHRRRHGPEPPQDHRPHPHPSPGRGGGQRPAPAALSEHGDRPGHRISASRRGDVWPLRLCRVPARHGAAARAGQAGPPGLRPYGQEPADLRPRSLRRRRRLSEAPAPGGHRRGRRRSGRHGAGKIRCRLPAGHGPAPRCSSVYPRIGHPRRAVLRTRRAKRFRRSLPPGDAGPAPHRLRPHGLPPGAGADPEQRPRLPGAGQATWRPCVPSPTSSP